MPKISIVIPSYKQERFLRECLESLQAQTFSDWEAIVVDDASPDGQLAAEIVRELDDSRIRLIRHEVNKGLAGARNTGISMARADLLAILDSDDQFMPTFCELAVKCFENPELNIVYGQFEVFGEWGSKVFPQRCPNGTLQLKARYFLPGPGFVMRRTVWETIGGYCEDEAYRLGGEERDFWIRSIPTINGFAQIPQVMYRYRQHSNSITANIGPHQYKIYRYIASKNTTILKQTGVYSLFLAEGYKRSSSYFLQKGEKLQALKLVLCGLLLRPTDKRLLRILLLAVIPSSMIKLRQMTRRKRFLPDLKRR